VSTPFVDATLPDGSRLHVVVPDITREHLAVNIRKFVVRATHLDELVRIGTLTGSAARFLEASVVSGLNILVAGGTQAGKTTLLNCIAAAIPAQERVVTAEEVFEFARRDGQVPQISAVYSFSPVLPSKVPSARKTPVAPAHSPVPASTVSSSENSPDPDVWNATASFWNSVPLSVVITVSAVTNTTDVVGVSAVGVMLVAVERTLPDSPPVRTPPTHRPTGEVHSGPVTLLRVPLPLTVLQPAASAVLPATSATASNPTPMPSARRQVKAGINLFMVSPFGLATACRRNRAARKGGQLPHKRYAKRLPA
jgi:energy-coupling factor transporter ATP-binding protein EcfA2